MMAESVDGNLEIENDDGSIWIREIVKLAFAFLLQRSFDVRSILGTQRKVLMSQGKARALM